MASKDLSLDLVEKLELMRKNGTDYLLIAIDPGKNVDRSDIWYELANKDSPENLLNSCLSLFTNIFDKDYLVNALLEFCEELDGAYEEQPDINDIIKEITQKKPRKKKNPPNDSGTTPSI